MRLLSIDWSRNSLRPSGTIAAWPRAMRCVGSFEISVPRTRIVAPPVLDEPHDRAQHRRLAGAVRPEQPDRLALADVQADVADDVVAPVAGVEPADLERGGAASLRRGTRRAPARPPAPRAAGPVATTSPAASTVTSSQSANTKRGWCSISTMLTPRLLSVVEDRRRVLDLARREAGQRLVEDQRLRAGDRAPPRAA